MAEIKHEIKIKALPEKAFEAVSTLEGLKAWHTADIDGDATFNGILRFKGSDKPLFRWQVVEVDPGKKITWRCLEGPGDAAGTLASYTLSKTDDGRTLVEFSHTSWPHEAGNFRKCNTLWGILLHHLKSYVETGNPSPAIP